MLGYTEHNNVEWLGALPVQALTNARQQVSEPVTAAMKQTAFVPLAGLAQSWSVDVVCMARRHLIRPGPATGALTMPLPA